MSRSVDQPNPEVIVCLPMALGRLTSGTSAHLAGRSNLRLQWLPAWAKGWWSPHLALSRQGQCTANVRFRGWSGHTI